MPTVHIIGAGVTGLACATRAAMLGVDVAVYEAAGHAGGRARSFYDEKLGCTIDNGNHLLLGANEATRAYLSDINAENTVQEIKPAAFPFLDAKTGESWRIRPGRRFPPMWLFSGDRRIPNTQPTEYFTQINRLRRAGKRDTVAAAVGTQSKLYENLWQPMTKAALNTDAAEASAALMWRVVRETFLRGEEACRPWYFHKGLSAALVEPALNFLTEQGALIRFNARLRNIRCGDHRVEALVFREGELPIGHDDAVVLALPPDACNDIWPDADAPPNSRMIVNAHFRLNRPVCLPWEMPFLGLINANTHWIFVRDNTVSLTISAADPLTDHTNEEIARKLWDEVATVTGLSGIHLPAWRIIKERRATFAQTPEQVNTRPRTSTHIQNLFLAGDWTDTGVPACIDGSVMSGYRAAEVATTAMLPALSEGTRQRNHDSV